MTPVFAWTASDIVANITAYGAIAAMAAFGFRHGVFLALLSAFVVMTGFVLAVALAPVSATYLESLGLEAELSLPVAYLLILVSVLSMARVVVGAALTEEDVRFRPEIDRFGGAAAGAFAGYILGGGLLVGWSMCHLPAGWRLDAPAMHTDSGANCLWMFVRWIHADRQSQTAMYGGDVEDKSAKMIRASEPFDDANGDWKRDDAEPFLGFVKDDDFTQEHEIREHALGKPNTRNTGLGDRYWLSAWRTLRVVHPPHITSAEYNASEQVARSGEVIYKAEAVDPDEGDELDYSLSGGADAMLLQIDPKTGEVRFGDGPVDPELKQVCFTVLVKDRSGLRDEHEVKITLRPPARAVP